MQYYCFPRLLLVFWQLMFMLEYKSWNLVFSGFSTGLLEAKTQERWNWDFLLQQLDDACTVQWCTVLLQNTIISSAMRFIAANIFETVGYPSNTVGIRFFITQSFIQQRVYETRVHDIDELWTVSCLWLYSNFTKVFSMHKYRECNYCALSAWSSRWSLIDSVIYVFVSIGPSVNKEYLSQIQFYSIFSKLPVMSNMGVIITVCVKVANSTFLVTNKRTKWAELSIYYLCNCFVR